MQKTTIIILTIVMLLATITLAQEEASRGLWGQVEREPSASRAIQIKNEATLNPFFWILLSATVIIIIKFKKLGKFLPIVLILWIVFILFMIKEERAPIYTENWQKDYQTKMKINQISEENLKETNYFDYSNLEVESVIKEIATSAKSPESAIQLTLDYVYNNVNYNAEEPDSTCFQATSSSVVASKTGQCDTQSITVISILRGLGIASRPVGGCIWKNAYCGQTFAVEAGPEPKYHDLKTEGISRLGPEDFEYWGRRGGLHAWAEAWVPEEGWITLEATAGRIMREGETCYNYLIETRPANGDKFGICVSKDFDFVKLCASK